MEQAKADLNLSFLLEHERETILRVLQKDEKVRKREEKRIRKLKNELLEIKRRGSRRTQEHVECGERQCARCLKTLGLIFDRGDFCVECQLRVCSECHVTNPTSRQWRCNVCAKISELKVATGEWFLEERSKRFEQNWPSVDVIKQTILSSPLPTEEKPLEDKPAFPELVNSDTPRSTRSALHSVIDGARRKGRMKMDRKASRPNLTSQKEVDSISIKSVSDGDARSLRSLCSTPGRRSNRGGAEALESSGLPTLPNNLRTQTLDKLSTSSSSWRVRPDGAESVASLQSSETTSEKKDDSCLRTDAGTPTISVSRASVSSDHSRSEMDLAAHGSEPSDDALSLRSRSVLGLNETVSFVHPLPHSPIPTAINTH